MVVLKKKEFECRELSKLSAFSVSFRVPAFRQTCKKTFQNTESQSQVACF